MKIKIENNSELIHKHLDLYQNVISRMASNSASIKNWCITLVSALLLFSIDKNNENVLFISFIPVLIFYLLDCYYLALEREFRESYNNFLNKLNNKNLHSIDLYYIKPTGNLFIITFKCLFSHSTYPFYLLLIGMIIIIKNYLI